MVFVFAAGPIMFSMGAVALGSICWPAVVLWNWFQWWEIFSKINVDSCVRVNKWSPGDSFSKMFAGSP